MGTTAVVRVDGAQAPTAIAQHRDVSDVAEIQRLGNLLAASGYFADAREMAQAAVKVMAGRELGVPPVASMMGINIIKGKVAMGAHLIASRIKAHGYDFRIARLDNTGCSLEFLGKPDAAGAREKLGDSSFTEEDAKSAQVFNDMYKKYPRNMYYSRAVSNGAKWFCPEVFAGAPVYTPEELGEEVDAEGEIVRRPESHEQLVNRRIAEEKAKAAVEEEERAKAAKQAKESKPASSAPKPASTPAPAPASTVPQNGQGYQATDDDLPENLGGTYVPPPDDADGKRVEQARQRAAEQPTATVKVTPDDFRKIRTEFLAFGAGGAAEYDRIVKKHGAADGALYPGKLGQAKAAFAELAESLKGMQSMNQEEPQPAAQMLDGGEDLFGAKGA